MARIDHKAILPKILAEWRTGEFSQRDLAAKFKVSNGFVAAHTKDVAQDTAPLVSALVKSKQDLANIDEHSAHAVLTLVDEKTKHIQLFSDATHKNISILCDKITPEISISDHRLVQATLKDGKETVLGKDPSTAIQVNNTNQTSLTVSYGD